MRNIFQEIRERGHDEDFNTQPPAEATDHAAGSWGKICVLEARVRRGESLWHPEDNPDHATYEEQQESCVKIKPFTFGVRTSVEAVAWKEKFAKRK